MDWAKLSSLMDPDIPENGNLTVLAEKVHFTLRTAINTSEDLKIINRMATARSMVIMAPPTKESGKMADIMEYLLLQTPKESLEKLRMFMAIQ